MRTLTVIISAVCLATAFPSAALADHGHPDATFQMQRAYIHCADPDLRLDNVTTATNPWDTSFPSGSFVNDGAGCGTIIEPHQNPPIVGQLGVFRAAGTSTGNLDVLTVQLHDMGHVAARPASGSTFPLSVTLRVDGEAVVSGARIAPTAVSENSGVTDRVTFSVVGLDLSEEEGDGVIVRELELDVIAEPGAFLVYDASEVPAGIVFNPFTLEPTRIEAG